jgi:hypothetical protein
MIYKDTFFGFEESQLYVLLAVVDEKKVIIGNKKDRISRQPIL